MTRSERIGKIVFHATTDLKVVGDQLLARFAVVAQKRTHCGYRGGDLREPDRIEGTDAFGLEIRDQFGAPAVEEGLVDHLVFFALHERPASAGNVQRV